MESKGLEFRTISAIKKGDQPWTFDVNLESIGNDPPQQGSFEELGDDDVPTFGDQFKPDRHVEGPWESVRAQHTKTVREFRVGIYENMVFRRPKK